MEVRSLIESRIEQKHLLAHPFYRRWQAGELTREELKGYAREYYPFEKEFSRFVSAVHTRCDDLQLRQMLLENLIHEEKGDENHQELWLRFAEGVGVPRDELQAHNHSDETEELLRVFRKNCQGEVVEGLASLFAYEKQQPAVAHQKIEGLKCFYGIEAPSTLQFFQAHEVSDVHHAETEGKLLDKLCVTDDKKEKAVRAAQETLDALYDFLSAVERRYGPTPQ